jgi:hypothetical protein
MGESSGSVSMDIEMIPLDGKVNGLYRFFVEEKVFY